MHSILWGEYMYHQPSFINVIKPKGMLSNKLLSSSSLKNIDSIITGAQKLIVIYNKAVPIINQSKPMIDNIKTTFKVAKAFKRFSNESSLEKAFDVLPDYEENTKEILKEESEVTNPFYP